MKEPYKYSLSMLLYILYPIFKRVDDELFAILPSRVKSNV